MWARQQLLELGELLTPAHAHRQRALGAGAADDTRLTIADSTGVGASDLCIAEAAYQQLARGGGGGSGAAARVHAWRCASRAPSRL